MTVPQGGKIDSPRASTNAMACALFSALGRSVAACDALSAETADSTALALSNRHELTQLMDTRIFAAFSPS